MRDAHVGCVVIADAMRRPIGVVTDRDLVVRAMAMGGRPDDPVEQYMSRAPVTADRDDELDEVVFAMRRAGVRRLPIVDDGGLLVGLVSLDDITVLLAGELSTSVGAIEDNRGP